MGHDGRLGYGNRYENSMLASRTNRFLFICRNQGGGAPPITLPFMAGAVNLGSDSVLGVSVNDATCVVTDSLKVACRISPPM